ncbi:unnamed protein product [Alopecurus aequalis]
MPMSTPLLNRSKRVRSARYSIRRGAGGGRFLMARRRVLRGGDRISALPDDLLLAVLQRLDTRTALGTAVLSKRWVRLPGELPSLDFRVGDILPPRYHRWVLLRGRLYKGTHVQYKLGVLKDVLLPNIKRYERRAMRALTGSLNRLLDADEARARRRRVSRLRLEFFVTSTTGCINRLIAKAIDAWGVEDLEAVAKPTFPIHPHRAVHAFPVHGLCKEPCASRLKSIKLGGCALPPLHDYTTLTKLVLQDIPDSPAAAYVGLFTSCPQLQTLHLHNCRCSRDGGLDVVVDAPMSLITELVVDKCFSRMWLRALPSLERLASLDSKVIFESASFPCLTHWNLAYDLGTRIQGFPQYFAKRLQLDHFLGRTADITDLIIRFTGPDRWIVPSSSTLSSPLLPNLRRLLVAQVPPSWDVSWICLLLHTAPSLESIHIHVAAPCEDEPGEEISWQPSKFRHHSLKEFVMAGFNGTERQIHFVRFVVGMCTALCHVAMFKDGHAQDRGHWDWELVTQRYSWPDKEKDVMLEQIMDGLSLSSIAPLQLLFA